MDYDIPQAVKDAVDQATGVNAPAVGSTAGTMPRGSWTAGQATVPVGSQNVGDADRQLSGANGGGQKMINPGAIDAALAAGQLAYNMARLDLDRIHGAQLNEREKERLAQEAFKMAWTKTYQQAQLSGVVPTEQSTADRAKAAWEKLPPEGRTPQAAAGIWKALVPGLTDQEAAAMHGQAGTYFAQTGTAMPDDLIQRTVTQLSGGRVSAVTPTLDREKMQNDTTLGLLDLQSKLRGPGDWAKYMQTVQAIPLEMRALISQTAGRFQLPGGPAGAASVAGLVGDATGAAPAAQAPVQAMQAAPPAAATPLGTTLRAPIQTAINAPIAGGGPPKVGVQPADPSAPGMENQTMNTAIRQAAGVQVPEFTAAMQPGTRPAGVALAPAGAVAAYSGAPAAPARYMTGTQLPRSFLGAGADAQDFVLGGAEAAGESRAQILHEFNQSLPKYQGSRRGRVKV